MYKNQKTNTSRNLLVATTILLSTIGEVHCTQQPNTNQQTSGFHSIEEPNQSLLENTEDNQEDSSSNRRKPTKREEDPIQDQNPDIIKAKEDKEKGIKDKLSKIFLQGTITKGCSYLFTPIPLVIGTTSQLFSSRDNSQTTISKITRSADYTYNLGKTHKWKADLATLILIAIGVAYHKMYNNQDSSKGKVSKAYKIKYKERYNGVGGKWNYIKDSWKGRSKAEGVVADEEKVIVKKISWIEGVKTAVKAYLVIYCGLFLLSIIHSAPVQRARALPRRRPGSQSSNSEETEENKKEIVKPTQSWNRTIYKNTLNWANYLTKMWETTETTAPPAEQVANKENEEEVVVDKDKKKSSQSSQNSRGSIRRDDPENKHNDE